MADALDLGSSPKGCRFNSCYPHQAKNLNKELAGVEPTRFSGPLKIFDFQGKSSCYCAPANLGCITLQLRLDKSVCIAPDNIASQALFKKYGFTKHCKRKCWDVYLCDKDFYPDELKQLKMVEIAKKS